MALMELTWLTVRDQDFKYSKGKINNNTENLSESNKQFQFKEDDSEICRHTRLFRGSGCLGNGGGRGGD